MPRIRNYASKAAAVSDTASVASTSQTAAAVSDTAAVAASSQRGPLHPASQGPLAPTAAVFDTAAVASRRATVSDTAAVAMGVVDTSIAASRRRPVTVTDTATVAPCLKSVYKYSARRPSKAQVQSILGKVDQEDYRNADVAQAVDRGLLHMEKHNNPLFKDVTKVYKFSNKRGALEKALEQYAAGKEQEWDAQWQVVWADYENNQTHLEERRNQVKAHYEDLETVLAESDDSTAKVSFASATVKEYVLTEWERVHVKLGDQRRDLQLLYELPWVPRTKYDSFAPVPSQSIKRGGTSAFVKDHMDLDDYSKRQLLLATRDWLRHGNIAALALHKNPLPHTKVAFVFSVFETPAQSTQSNDVVDTSSAVARPPTVVVSDTTASTPSDVIDTSAAAVSDTAVATTATPSDVVDTSAAAVSDTAVATTATPSDVIDTSMASGDRSRVRARQASVVTDTTAVQPLRRSARIAANANTAAHANPPRNGAPSPRRTTRKGAVKPMGFYKV